MQCNLMLNVNVDSDACMQAAATSCYVATNPRMVDVSGKYYSDCNEASTSKIGSSWAEAARLWAASEDMVSTDHNSNKV